MTFSPRAYTKKAHEAADAYDERRQFEKDNAHLAMPFPVVGLQDKIPPQYPTEMSMFGAASGDGKSLFLKFWHDFTQGYVSAQKRRAVVPYVSHEDTTEMSAGQLIEKNGGDRVKVDSNLTLYIGRTFGMNPDDVADLYMSNIFQCLEYGSKEAYAETMPYAGIFYDYIQATPPDPFRREMTNDNIKRLQMADDTRRLFIAATTFQCPVIAAAQTSLKNVRDPYNEKMKIPGRADFEEAKEIFQTPDRVFTGWLPSASYPIGEMVEVGNWRFEVKPNLFFLRVLKVRYHSPETAPGIRRVFPLLIENGEFIYDPEYHKSINFKPEKK